VVDALEASPDALNFYIGHELGHFKRSHLIWGPILFPALLLPLLGAAYSRAREYTCDMHGAACSPSRELSARALAALAAGGKRWKTVDLNRLAADTRQTSGFWMSFHELVAGYPWLTKRIARVLGGEHAKQIPNRNGFAYLLAIFVPNAGMGAGAGLVSLMVVVAIIGILAAVAIPAYQDYTVRAKVAQVIQDGNAATDAVTEHFERTKAVPQSLGQTRFQPTASAALGEWSVDERGLIRFQFSVSPVAGKVLVFIPSMDASKRVVWRCAGETLEQRYLPMRCRGGPQQ
jgi:Tfp pilus assembly protein PilE